MANSPSCLSSSAAYLYGAPTSFAGGSGRPEPAPVLAGSVDPQHPHVAGGIVAAGVGSDVIERPPAAGAETLAHARMTAEREPARMVAEILDCGQDRIQPGPGGWSRAGLGQPSSRVIEVGKRAGREDQPARHAAWSGATDRRERQGGVGAQAIDPCPHVGNIDMEAGVEFGARLGDAFGFPGEAVFALGLGLLVMGKLGGLGHRRIITRHGPAG